MNSGVLLEKSFFLFFFLRKIKVGCKPMILWRREGKSGLSGNKVFVMLISFLSSKALPTPPMPEAACLVHFFLAVSDTVS